MAYMDYAMFSLEVALIAMPHWDITQWSYLSFILDPDDVQTYF